jgi:MFS family permease
MEEVLGRSDLGIWITSSVTIATVVLSPPVSQAADYWGRRWFLIILTGCGAVGSIIIARANGMPMVIGGSIIAGLSTGAQPLLHAVASEVIPRRYRTFAQAILNGSSALGGFVALLAGGALTKNDASGFRNYFYFTTGAYVLATVLCALLYVPPPKKSQLEFTTREKLGKLDWVGYFLLTLGLVLFCVGLSWSQNPYPWSDPHVSATFVIGVAALVGLVFYEWKIKKDGMLHHSLFTTGNQNFPISLLCIFIEGLAFFAGNNYFAFEASVLYETNSVRTGLRYGVGMLTVPVFFGVDWFILLENQDSSFANRYRLYSNYYCLYLFGNCWSNEL